MAGKAVSQDVQNIADVASLLGKPSPVPLSQQVQDADVRYAQGQKDCTIAQSDYYQRRMDRAHRRFLSAVRTLAVVRRLALPVLLAQVNVAAKQQVNVGPSRRGERSDPVSS